MKCRFALWCFMFVSLVAPIACSKGPAKPGNSTGAVPQEESPTQAVGKAAPRNPATVPPTEPAVIPLEAPSPDGHNNLTKEEIADGWLRLFDGATMYGWVQNTGETVEWTVKDGLIIADKGAEGNKDKGLLLTTTRFADYELRCDVRIDVGGNSGIFLRTPMNPTNPGADCIELNMCDSHPAFPTAALVDRAKPESPVMGDGAWHTYHVRVDGSKITVSFDGKQVLEYTDTTAMPLKTGFIGLQKNAGQAEFRNVFLKPLGTKPLFNGTSLEGWHETPGSKSQFTIEDGAIHVKDGPGFLESDVTAANFVFQFEAKTNGDNLNSGVFFRSLKGTEKPQYPGYEFQIQNQFKNGDRSKPQDFGTGAIFRRATARRVVSDDHQWLTGTLVADGPTFSTWVNGIQVCEWVDQREDNENPRDGRRLAAGHFSLQGHDPSTDLLFRNLRLAETPE